MPKKKKSVIKKSSIQVEVETSDDQAEKPRRSLRPRCKAEATAVVNKLASKYQKSLSKKKQNDEVQSENAYDADSESDQNLESDSEVDEVRMTADPVSDSDAIMEDRSAIESTTSSNHHLFERMDKENITPPGSHSTPTVVQRAVRNLDESLFGFNNLESPLAFSPLGRNPHGPTSPTYSSRSSTISTSPSTRKRVRYDVPDIPIENPKKRAKKKTKKEVIQEDDPYEEIRKQFQQVEMHKLVIE